MNVDDILYEPVVKDEPEQKEEAPAAEVVEAPQATAQTIGLNGLQVAAFQGLQNSTQSLGNLGLNAYPNQQGHGISLSQCITLANTAQSFLQTLQGRTLYHIED